MRLVLISDTHCTRPQLPQGDVLVFAGDLTMGGSFKELEEEVKWLQSLPYRLKVFVPGNHDIAVETLMNKGLERRMRELLFKDVHYLRDSGIVLDGIRFWGTPFIPKSRVGSGAFIADEAVLAQHFAKIPLDIDVLVTHTPPARILDDGVGSTELAAAVQRVSPKLNVFGHVHDCGGKQCVIGRTLYVNAAKHPLVCSL
jgi:Icc-related predicted phosphoesterase